MSFILRYIQFIESEEENCITKRDVKIAESFLEIFYVKDSTSTIIINTMKEFGLTLNKCRDQGYNGALTMSRAYTGGTI